MTPANYQLVDVLIAGAGNAAPCPGAKSDPNVHDGPRTIGLPIHKAGWAYKLDTAPYNSYIVMKNVTFGRIAAFARRN